ncbi:MAG: isoprenylcysteine carboxylmethyltransferase family protein [Planctomycetales bacterium]|nr:isoprenylcysteine carboxylmethyltransferase family protein [Planctomycetales bacterium]
MTVFWLLAASVIDSRWGEDSPIGLTLLVLGYALTGVGVIGRVWCLSYIAGHKTADLVTDGPYSLCRNPLYFFSLLGAVGVGLGSSTLTFPLLVMVGFAIYYPAVIKAEAHKLAGIHGDAYQAYRQMTPALLPSLKHFHESNEQLIHSRAFRRGLFDSFWFFAALALMHVFAEWHHSGLLPAWYVMP